MTAILLPTLPAAEPLPEAVLFGFDDRFHWPTAAALPTERRLRLKIRFDGVRPEDARLYALHLGEGTP